MSIKNLRVPKKFFSIVVALACVSLIYIARFFLRPGEQSSLDPKGGVRSIGSLSAPVKIIEFFDFQCPACREGSFILKNYLKRFPEQIYLEQRYFPIGTIHRHAYQSAYFAECAARQGRFWEFYELLFKRQREWEELSREEAHELFMQMALFLKLDLERLQVCVDSSVTQSVVLSDKVNGEKFGAKATPTYFINGNIVVGTDSLQRALPQVLGEKKY